MDKDKRIKALEDESFIDSFSEKARKRLNSILIGDNPEVEQRMLAGKMNPMDVMSITGRGYDSVVGAPTRSALKAGYEGENPLAAAASQFGENPDTAPDFGMVGNALADPFIISGAVAKGAKFASQLGEAGGALNRVAMHSPSSGAEFKAALDAAIEKRPMIKDFVSDYSADDLEKFKTFLSEDKLSGYAIKPDGDLINVFSSAKQRGDKIMRDAAENAPKTLDAFDVDAKLPSLYKRYGFNEIKREPNWTPGGPDVVFMKKGFVDRPQDIDNVLLQKYLRLKALEEAAQQAN